MCRRSTDHRTVEEVSIADVVVEEKVSTSEAAELDEAASEIELSAESEVPEHVIMLDPVLDVLTRGAEDSDHVEDVAEVDELTAAGA